MDNESEDRYLLLELKKDQNGNPSHDSKLVHETMKRAKELIKDLEATIVNSPLPERVPTDAIDEWFFNLRMQHMTVE